MNADRRILLVEDDEDMAEHLQESIGDQGLRVITSSSLYDAKVKLSNEVFSVIVVDLNLGARSGVDLIKFIITEESINNKSAIVLMSGLMDKPALDDIGSHLKAAFVKPFDPKEFADKIKELHKQDQRPVFQKR